MPPLWKRLLSYFFELHIESAPSEINPHLYVSLKRGRYQLCTANAVYSYADLYDNFAGTFEQITLPSDGATVLLLGFGLGSIPYILEKKQSKTYHYTAVEIDENVLYLANKYTLPMLESPISFIPADASVFVHSCTDQFDLICMDIFLDDVVPTVFETEDFLVRLKELLNPQGVLLFNKLALTKADKAQATAFFTVFKKVFPKGNYLELKGNRMFLNKFRSLTNSVVRSKLKIF